MKIIIIAFGFIIGGFNTLFSQINMDKMAFMQGNWAGELEYTDYQDDKKIVQLKTLMTTALMDNKMQFSYTYTEPNGSLVYSNDEMKPTQQGDMLKWGSMKFKIMTHTEGGKETVLVLEANGEDNDKKAVIRETIRSWSQDSLSILKEVKYNGSDKFFTRHIYRFKKEKTEDTQARLLKDLVGTWELDLRPSPEDKPYLKDFEIKNYQNGQLTGIFYETDFNEGKINTDWGKIYFSFTTADQSSVYFHSGYVEKGIVHGTSFSKERNFMIPWQGRKK